MRILKINLLVLLIGMTHAAHATPCGVLSIAAGKSTIDVSEPFVLYIGTGYIPTTIVGIPPPKPPFNKCADAAGCPTVQPS